MLLKELQILHSYVFNFDPRWIKPKLESRILGKLNEIQVTHIDM